MKSLHLIVLIALFSFSTQANSQTLTFKTSSISTTEKNQKGVWEAWTDFIDAKLIITIDGKKNRIVINSPDIQVFTITNYGEKIETEVQKTVPFECIDNNGSKCKILVITHKNEQNRMQFYIIYSDVKFVYNIYN
jgi:hypothetical protein